jgi:hypothetical protein
MILLAIAAYLVWLIVWLAERPGRLPRLPRDGRWALLVVIAAGTLCAQKPGTTRTILARFVTALRSGALLDDSGRIAALSTVAVTAYYTDAAAQIVAAASNTVVGAQAQFDGLAEVLTNRTLTVAYIAMDLPRAEAHSATNHNLAASIERVTYDSPTNLTAWVWFSEAPAVEPLVAFDASVSAGSWTRLVAVTNSYPSTVEVDGIPCVAYTFALPAPMRGIVLRPEYELSFGGSGTNDYLVIPSGGVLVETNNVPRLPYTGWDREHPAPYGTNLQIRYAGGVAVQALWMGTNYTGVVTL